MSGDYIDIPVGGGRFEDLVSLAAGTDREAILKAADALKREEAGPGHMADLWAAVARFRGPYIQASNAKRAPTSRAAERGRG